MTSFSITNNPEIVLNEVLIRMRPQGCMDFIAKRCFMYIYMEEGIRLIIHLDHLPLLL